jgi:hypothetical protein
MSVVRERGPELAPRLGPGYHDYLPHDAVHFLVEAEAGLRHAVFGGIEAGRANLFWPADPRQIRRQSRKQARRRPTPAEREETARSEELASICQVLWEVRAGLRAKLPDWADRVDRETLASALVDRILDRLTEFAEQWNALPADSGITLRWSG